MTILSALVTTFRPDRTVTARWLVTALAVLLPAAARAHHGLANFDLNTEISVTGTVTRIAFVNPHSWVYLDVAGDDGQVQAWRCELRGAAVLRRSGWTPEMFAAGTEITITGAPDRFEPRTCYFGTAVFADGSSVDRYGQLARPAPAPPATRPARRPDGVPNLAGDWAAEQRMLTNPRGMSGAFLPMSVARALDPGDVPEGMQAFPGTRGTDVSLAEDPIDAYWNRPSAMPLTDAGARAIEGFDGASADNPRLRCEITNILFDWTFEADVNRIVQDEDRITLLYGTMGLERTIHLDGAGPPDDLEPSRGGYSTGRWEGDELVVETVGFLPGILSADGRIPHSDQMRVVERFALDPARPALRRTYVAEDPLYLQGAYTGSDVVYPADAPYTETACDDRSYRSDAEDGPRRPPGAHNDFIFSVLPGELTSSWTLIWTGGGLLAAMGVLLLIRRRRR
jgi:hypothetical protein